MRAFAADAGAFAALGNPEHLKILWLAQLLECGLLAGSFIPQRTWLGCLGEAE